MSDSISTISSELQRIAAGDANKNESTDAETLPVAPTHPDPVLVDLDLLRRDIKVIPDDYFLSKTAYEIASKYWLYLTVFMGQYQVPYFGWQLPLDAVGASLGVVDLSVAQSDVESFTKGTFATATAWLREDLKQKDLDLSTSHPLFVSRFSWDAIQKLRPSIVQLLHMPSNGFHRFVHRSQEIMIHHPLKAGNVTVGSKLIGMQPHNLGAKIDLHFTCYQDGQLAVEEFSSAILLGANCARKRVLLDQKKTLFENVDDKQTVWTEMIALERSAPYIYEKYSGIHAPIHTDPSYARASGVPDILVHGTAIQSLALNLLMEKEKFTMDQVVGVGGSFVGMVTPPNNLVVRLIERRDNKLLFDVRDERVKHVVRGGVVELR